MLFRLLARLPRVGWSNCILLALQVQMRAGLDLPGPSSSLPPSALDALPTASPPPATVGGQLDLRIFNTAAGAPILVCRMAEQAGVGAAYLMFSLPEGREQVQHPCSLILRIRMVQAPWALTLEVPSWRAFSSAGAPAAAALSASALQNVTLAASSDALAPASLNSQNFTLSVTALFQAHAATTLP